MERYSIWVIKKCNKGKILPCVPILAKNIKLAYTDLTQYLGDSEYCSGVNKEGIVLSSYDKEGNVTMGKFVDELFEEVKRKNNQKVQTMMNF